MEKTLTQEQIEALNLNLNIALNANAGSGKTTVLVNRFFEILRQSLISDSDITSDNIVAITFTKKAAGEMLARVIEQFNNSFSLSFSPENSASPDLRKIERIRTFRNKLTNARISTIHSFCLQILTDYPIEAGIPVNYREITESERLQLLDEAFNFGLMKWLEDVNKKTELSTILADIDLDDLKELSIKVISNLDLWNELNRLYSGSYENYLDILSEYLIKTYKKPFLMFINSLFDLIPPELQIKLGIDADAKLINDNLSENHTHNFEFVTENTFWSKLANFLNRLLTKKGEPRKNIAKTSEETYNELNLLFENYRRITNYSYHIAEYGSFRNELKMLNPSFDIERRYFETSKSIFNFIKDVYEKFQKMKYDEGFIDFNDMLVKTRDLFKSHPEILNEVRSKIKYLMIDEFQDTDELQLEIVKMLVPINTDGQIDRPNLFIVGDEKQSIYSFRNADVRVFQKAKNYIAQLNQNQHSSSTTNGLMKLTSTFRLKLEIAAFTDYVFSKLMSISSTNPYSEFEVAYEPFVIPSGKFILDTVETDPLITPISFLFATTDVSKSDETDDFLDDTNDVDYIPISTELYEQILELKERGKKNYQRTLEEFVSDHIEFIVNNEKITIYDKDIKKYRKIKYSDIAILSRKTKDLSSLVNILAKRNIPFIFFGSKNFFSTREVQDVISFLKFCLNQKNDIALAAILRSSFFAFTDEMLLNIATITSDKITFWEKLFLYRDYLYRSDYLDSVTRLHHLSKVETALYTIQKILESARILPLNELIHRIIVETNWTRNLRAFKNYEQILANIDELLDYAREYVSAGFRTILDFIDDVEYITQYGISDVDRFGFVASDAVKLLTIHSAKGLEFPVVYLFRTESKARTGQNIIVSREVGLVYPMRIRLGDEIFKAKTLQNYLGSEQLEMEQSAEEKRLFYVAMTRASDYLIITGNLKRSFSKLNGYTFFPSYMLKNIFDTLTFELKNITGNFTKFIHTNIRIGYNDGIKKEDISIPLKFYFDIFTPIFLPKEFADETGYTKETSETIVLTDKIESSIQNNIFSSTKFNLYQNNPKDYLKSYFLGIHRNLSEIMKSNLDEDYDFKDNLILGSIVGNIVHKCLEKISRWFNEDGFFIDNLIEIVNDSIFEEKRIISLEIQNSIITQCTNVVQSKLFSKYKERIFSGKKEFEIFFPFADNYLVAKIDLLIENEDGEFEIWDWKTNNITKEEIPSVGELYRLQMETYVFALSKLFPLQKKFKARLLFTRLVQPNSEDEDWTYEFNFDNTQVQAFERTLLDYIRKINQLEI